MTLYADLCVRLQNASRAKLKSVPIPYTKANVAISAILLQHGFIYNMTRGSIAGPSAVDWNTAPMSGSDYGLTLNTERMIGLYSSA